MERNTQKRIVALCAVVIAGVSAASYIYKPDLVSFVVNNASVPLEYGLPLVSTLPVLFPVIGLVSKNIFERKNLISSLLFGLTFATAAVAMFSSIKSFSSKQKENIQQIWADDGRDVTPGYIFPKLQSRELVVPLAGAGIAFIAYALSNAVIKAVSTLLPVSRSASAVHGGAQQVVVQPQFQASEQGNHIQPYTDSVSASILAESAREEQRPRGRRGQSSQSRPVVDLAGSPAQNTRQRALAAQRAQQAQQASPAL
jgi:hypothetical protein